MRPVEHFLHTVKKYGFYYKRDLMTWKDVMYEGKSVLQGQVPHTTRQIEDGEQLRVELDTLGFSRSIAIWCLNGVLCEGPKIIRLSKLDFAQLEEIDITLNLEDYAQPFPTVVVEWPDDYADARVTADPREGILDEQSLRMHTSTHKPQFAIIRHDHVKRQIFVTVHLSSYDQYTTVLYQEDKTIEDALIEKISLDNYEGSAPVTDEENRTYIPVIRAALNACLHVVDYGCKRQEPTDPKRLRRLEHFVKTARKSKDPARIKRATRELTDYPVIYTIEQDVRLAVTSEPSPNGGGSGRSPGPHWRRKHYRMQRFGPGLSQRKRIRIERTRVNWKFFEGDDKDTSVELHD